jgi:hypothetical protein
MRSDFTFFKTENTENNETIILTITLSLIIIFELRVLIFLLKIGNFSESFNFTNEPQYKGFFNYVKKMSTFLNEWEEYYFALLDKNHIYRKIINKFYILFSVSIFCWLIPADLHTK